MCTSGINSADYKLALHQQEQLAKHVSNCLKQWSDLASMVGESELGEEIAKAVAKANEAAEAIHKAAHAVDHHHEHGDHGHGHGVTITSV